MIVDPIEAVKKTKSILVPTSSTGPIVTPTPLPSVFPDPIVRDVIHGSGTKALWVVFVIMLVASIIFAALSWRIAVVRPHRLERRIVQDSY